MAEKVTVMILKVDLQCPKCYKKVKKLLCKFPQIRDQVYDEKANTVTITVVCCSPEKIRDKLCCKGRGTIKSIDIKEPPKPKPDQDKPKPNPAAAPKPAENPPADKPKDKPKQVVIVEVHRPASPKPPVKAPEPAPKAPEPAPKSPGPVPVVGYPPPYPTYGGCCGPCYDGRPGGPCYGGHGMPMPMPMPAPPCHCGCGGRSVCYDGYGRGYTVSRCDYFSEENPAVCAVM